MSLLLVLVAVLIAWPVSRWVYRGLVRALGYDPDAPDRYRAPSAGTPYEDGEDGGGSGD